MADASGPLSDEEVTGVVLAAAGQPPVYTVRLNTSQGPLVVSGVTPCANRPPSPLIIRPAPTGTGFKARIVRGVLQAYILEWPDIELCGG